jgi:hypothetical protein
VVGGVEAGRVFGTLVNECDKPELLKISEHPLTLDKTLIIYSSTKFQIANFVLSALLGVTHYVDHVSKTLSQTSYLRRKENLSPNNRVTIHYGSNVN